METDQRILVVPREKLFEGKEFNGFISHNETLDYESRILSNSFFHPRQDAENNTSLKQPIGYCIIYNPKTQKIFLYRRAKKDTDCKEKRLQGKYSIGIGGHIDEIDADQEGNPIKTSTSRELIEEIGLKSCDLITLGYLNDEQNSVGTVHFGLVYAVLTDLNEIMPNSGEITECSFKTVKELEQLLRDSKAKQIEIENWSQYIIEHLSDLTEKIKC